jgi:hypothetical protein
MMLIAVIISFVAIPLSVLSGVAKWRIYQQTAMLRLADDANTPEQKSRFLGQYLDALESRPLPEYGAFVFKTERNRVANQLDVVRSLKKRCDDLAVVDPSSLGYAQGMEQITGQEFTGALTTTGRILEDALWVQTGWIAAYGWLMWGLAVVFFVLAGITGMGTY